MVALAQATMEWFSLYSFSKTWCSPCKGHKESMRCVSHRVIDHSVKSHRAPSMRGSALDPGDKVEADKPNLAL